MKTGYNGRRRFSLKFPDGSISRYGCCDPKIDSGRTILWDGDKSYWLVQELCDCQFEAIPNFLIPDGTMASLGYYDKEHEEWMPVNEFYGRYFK